MVRACAQAVLLLLAVGNAYSNGATHAAVAKQIYPPSVEHSGPAWFEDVAGKAGIRVLNANGGVDSKRYILEATGSGVAIFDYDNDGWPDIFLVNGDLLPGEDKKTPRPTSHLFHNNHDGTFTDVTAHAGLTDTGWGQGVCVGDYDNDGYEDLFVTAYGKNRLYHNQGNGTFGLGRVYYQQGPNTPSILDNTPQPNVLYDVADFNGDGKPDVVMTEAPHGTAPRLYGKNVANPMAMILACAALLVFVDDRRATTASRAIYESVLETVRGGIATSDLNGHASTSEFTDAVTDKVKSKLEVWASL